ncbi:MAG: hypothetical protein K2I67_00680, partial [Malacoplasma sp.]|nr:hypothetical protein [Malacoplasma sp.]
MSKKSKLMILNLVALVSLSFSLLPVSWLTVDSFKNETYSLIESNKKLDSVNRLNSAFDYIPVTNNVNAQPVSTSVGFLGINSNNNVLYLTSYEGLTVWEFNATNNSMIKSFYKDVLNISNISGYTIKSWKYLSSIDVIAISEYENANNNDSVLNTTLSKLINVPYVSFSDLQINKLNISNSEKLYLTVSVKYGTISTLFVNRNPFVFGDTTENNFATNGLDYLFNISAKINTIEQKFAWKKSDSILIDSIRNKDNNFCVNLNNEFYPPLNSQIYANDVTIDNIFELFVCNCFVLNKNSINLFVNNQEGIVYAIINLISTDSNLQDTTFYSSDSDFQLQSSYTKKIQNTISDGSNFTKRIEISGFKKPISPVYIVIFWSVIVIISIAIIS